MGCRALAVLYLRFQAVDNGSTLCKLFLYPSGMASSRNLSVLCYCFQSECQQLICDILRATPDAASADAAVQTARLASKADPHVAKYVLAVCAWIKILFIT